MYNRYLWLKSDNLHLYLQLILTSNIHNHEILRQTEY